jgi:hypothetical protein
MLEIALYRVAATGRRIRWIFRALRSIGEAVVQLTLTPVGQMRETAGDLQTGVGGTSGAVLVTVPPVRVGLDGRDLGALGADLIGGGTRTHR